MKKRSKGENAALIERLEEAHDSAVKCELLPTAKLFARAAAALRKADKALAKAPPRHNEEPPKCSEPLLGDDIDQRTIDDPGAAEWMAYLAQQSKQGEPPK